MGSPAPKEENPMPDTELGGSSPESDPFDFDDLADWDSDLHVERAFERSDPAHEDDAEREGLPQTYSMRHERHYIDELMSGASPQQIVRVPVKDIVSPSETLPDPSAVVEPLARSVARLGVLQPVLVRRKEARYELVAGEKRLEAARAAGVREIPCLLCNVDDAQAERLRDALNLHVNPGTLLPARLDELMLEIVDSLQTIVSGLSLLRGSESRDRDQGALDLLRSEANRTMRYAFGASFLGSTPKLNKESFDAAQALEDALVGMEEETDDAPQIVKEVVGPCTLHADRSLFSVAIVSALDAVRPQVTSREGFVAIRMGRHEASDGLVVQLRPSDPGSPVPAPAQHAQSGPDSHSQPESRWLDPTWRDRPGGLRATVGLLVARRIAALHGGRMAVSSRWEGGCWVGLLFPTRAPGIQ
jgi:hypothetical protein